MSWKETDPMTERMKFIIDYNRSSCSLAELCRRYNISRKTAYKWISRFKSYGCEGLKDRSRAHFTYPHSTPDSMIDAILELKKERRTWGPKKLKIWLEINHPDQRWPSASTIGCILSKRGLVQPRKYKRYTAPHPSPLTECHAPNQVWCVDYKGQFRMGTDEYCYPLTITDNYSRFLFACDGAHQISGKNAQQSFERIFSEYGLPDVIRSDNGSPFASTGAGGLSALSVWWIKCGIFPERIKPGRPDQNGRHERMHKTLKETIATLPSDNLIIQQQSFDAFIREYNEERPHESLGNKRPAEVYKKSHRSLPNQLPEIEYDKRHVIRRVRQNGEIKWKGKKIYISQLLQKEPVGLLEINNDQFDIYFGPVLLGTLSHQSCKLDKPPKPTRRYRKKETNDE